MAWSVSWIVRINGQDMSSRMRPFLIDIEVTDKEGFSSDTCQLTFDDRGGHIKLPPKGSLVEVWLQGVLVFRGRSDAPRSTGSRGGGRLLKLSAKGFDTRGKAKEQQSFHMDDATLMDFLGEAAKNAGFELKIDAAFGAIKRDYWSADGESFMALGQRMARELNGTFKLRDKTAVLAARGENALPVVNAVVGERGNVINWDIEPTAGRGAFKKAKVRWFDREKAKFEEKDVEIDVDDGAEAENSIRTLAADEDQADGIAKGRKGEAEREAGGGTIEMDLVPHAQAEAPLNLTGARRGVDGSYKIVTVTQKANRRGGATTRCEVKQPGSAVGRDDRKPAGAGTGDGESGNLAPVPGLS